MSALKSKSKHVSVALLAGHLIEWMASWTSLGKQLQFGSIFYRRQHYDPLFEDLLLKKMCE
jgi:hypothetical protein